MSEMHTIALDRLNTAVRLVVRGFGSNEAEVEAVALRSGRARPRLRFSTCERRVAIPAAVTSRSVADIAAGSKVARSKSA